MLCVEKEYSEKGRFILELFHKGPPNIWSEFDVESIYNPLPTFNKSTTVAKITIGSQQQQQHYIKNIVLLMYVHT